MNLLYVCSLVFLVSITSIMAPAREASVSQKAADLGLLQKLAADYHRQKARSALDILAIAKTTSSVRSNVVGRQLCDPHQPNTSSCIQEVCSHLPNYLCDDQADLAAVGKVCAEQKTGDCISSVCSKLPSYLCDDLGDMKTVGQICSKVYDSSCVDAVCSRLPSYLCDDVSDFQAVGKICTGFVDRNCIDTICSKLPSYLCDDLSDLQKVVESCKGH